MNEPLEAVWAKSDKKRVTVFTRAFRFEGYLHTPKIGKASRLITDVLNADRNFVTLTQVKVTDSATGNSDGTVHEMLQVCLSAIEFIKPHFDE